MSDPGPMNERLVTIVEELASSWTLTEDANTFATAAMLESGVVGTGANATLGDFDEERIAQFMAEVGPILAETNPDFDPETDVTTIFTNEFIDPEIGL